MIIRVEQFFIHNFVNHALNFPILRPLLNIARNETFTSLLLQIQPLDITKFYDICEHHKLRNVKIYQRMIKKSSSFILLCYTSYMHVLFLY